MKCTFCSFRDNS